MRKFSRALSFVMTLAMLLSGIATAEQQYFNNGGGGEFVDPHTFTKPYTVNEVIVPADEATGQVALEAHVKNIIEVDGLKFKDLNGNGTLDVYEDWRQPVDAPTSARHGQNAAPAHFGKRCQPCPRKTQGQQHSEQPARRHRPTGGRHTPRPHAGASAPDWEAG